VRVVRHVDRPKLAAIAALMKLKPAIALDAL
jgi:hypothetical protein